MPESCSHPGYDFESRLEYCEAEAAEREGAAGVVVEMLDSLLYESGVVTSEEYKLQSNRESQIFTRTFSYLQGDPKSWVWPLTETEVAISTSKTSICTGKPTKWRFHGGYSKAAPPKIDS